MRHIHTSKHKRCSESRFLWMQTKLIAKSLERTISYCDCRLMVHAFIQHKSYSTILVCFKQMIPCQAKRLQIDYFSHLTFPVISMEKSYRKHIKRLTSIFIFYDAQTLVLALYSSTHRKPVLYNLVQEKEKHIRTNKVKFFYIFAYCKAICSYKGK